MLESDDTGSAPPRLELAIDDGTVVCSYGIDRDPHGQLAHDLVRHTGRLRPRIGRRLTIDQEIEPRRRHVDGAYSDGSASQERPVVHAMRSDGGNAGANSGAPPLVAFPLLRQIERGAHFDAVYSQH